MAFLECSLRKGLIEILKRLREGSPGFDQIREILKISATFKIFYMLKVQPHRFYNEWSTFIQKAMNRTSKTKTRMPMAE